MEKGHSRFVPTSFVVSDMVLDSFLTGSYVNIATDNAARRQSSYRLHLAHSDPSTVYALLYPSPRILALPYFTMSLSLLSHILPLPQQNSSVPSRPVFSTSQLGKSAGRGERLDKEAMGQVLSMVVRVRVHGQYHRRGATRLGPTIWIYCMRPSRTRSSVGMSFIVI